MDNYSILIADNENNDANLLEKILIKQNYIIYKASTKDMAFKVIENHQIDLVITDIEMSNLGLVSKINSFDSTIKVILLTANTTIEITIEALEMGVVDFIKLPINIKHVLHCVEEALNNKRKNNVELLKNNFSSKSSKMQQSIELMNLAINSESAVMLYGENGTGKELAAKVIHNLSARADKPFIKVNCASIPDNLLESELWGYEKGSISGTTASRAGKIELSNGGSIFLDEIGDITPPAQVKLLRILQECEFRRLGRTKTLKVDLRIIAATDKNLEELVKKGKFRQDLYYRLNIITIMFPLLRERREDIYGLVNYFLDKYSVISGKNKKMLSNAALEKLKKYYWYGNIRELENVIERCVALTPATVIELKNLPQYILNYNENLKDQSINGLDYQVDFEEKNRIFTVLKECLGSRTRASEVLGISKRSVYRKIAKYNIEV